MGDAFLFAVKFTTFQLEHVDAHIPSQDTVGRERGVPYGSDSPLALSECGCIRNSETNFLRMDLHAKRLSPHSEARGSSFPCGTDSAHRLGGDVDVSVPPGAVVFFGGQPGVYFEDGFRFATRGPIEIGDAVHASVPHDFPRMPAI